MNDQQEKGDAYWQSRLTPEQFEICRKKGTERPFTGQYYTETSPGTYLCACCEAPLFDADTKYDSGSGWPSFYAAVDTAIIDEHQDVSRGMVRTEITCSRCGSHLGHVFEDGPQPTGLRYCVNSLSLTFEKK